MTEAEKERIKLSANFLNTLATATIALGLIAPTVSAVLGIVTGDPARLVVGVAVWLVMGTGIHLAARTLLKRLDQ
jgi:hypothetical protein